MKKLLMLVAIAVTLVLAPAPCQADPQKEIDDAMEQVQQAIPVLERTLKTLQREAPHLIEVMQKASAEAQKHAGEAGPLRDGQIPSSDTISRKLRGLQSALETLRGALPVLERVQRDLEGVRVGTPSTRAPSTPASTPPAPSNPPGDDPDLRF